MCCMVVLNNLLPAKADIARIKGTSIAHAVQQCMCATAPKYCFAQPSESHVAKFIKWNGYDPMCRLELGLVYGNT